ncbi:hypothetical protein ACFCX4_23670 [Kitasatospora sp. NPDC056327]|uniref:hypothetical protein n=1 Tax=Kitasatospora sp. NPDC056327 TaxID=3345785 RepID=UPI0035E14F3C
MEDGSRQESPGTAGSGNKQEGAADAQPGRAESGAPERAGAPEPDQAAPKRGSARPAVEDKPWLGPAQERMADAEAGAEARTGPKDGAPAGATEKEAGHQAARRERAAAARDEAVRRQAATAEAEARAERAHAEAAAAQEARWQELLQDLRDKSGGDSGSAGRISLPDARARIARETEAALRGPMRDYPGPRDFDAMDRYLAPHITAAETTAWHGLAGELGVDVDALTARGLMPSFPEGPLSERVPPARPAGHGPLSDPDTAAPVGDTGPSTEVPDGGPSAPVGAPGREGTTGRVVEEEGAARRKPDPEPEPEEEVRILRAPEPGETWEQLEAREAAAAPGTVEPAELWDPDQELPVVGGGTVRLGDVHSLPIVAPGTGGSQGRAFHTGPELAERSRVLNGFDLRRRVLLDVDAQGKLITGRQQAPWDTGRPLYLALLHGDRDYAVLPTSGPAATARVTGAGVARTLRRRPSVQRMAASGEIVLAACDAALPASDGGPSLGQITANGTGRVVWAPTARIAAVPTALDEEAGFLMYPAADGAPGTWVRFAPDGARQAVAPARPAQARPAGGERAPLAPTQSSTVTTTAVTTTTAATARGQEPPRPDPGSGKGKGRAPGDAPESGVVLSEEQRQELEAQRLAAATEQSLQLRGVGTSLPVMPGEQAGESSAAAAARPREDDGGAVRAGAGPQSTARVPGAPSEVPAAPSDGLPGAVSNGAVAGLAGDAGAREEARRHAIDPTGHGEWSSFRDMMAEAGFPDDIADTAWQLVLGGIAEQGRLNDEAMATYTDRQEQRDHRASNTWFQELVELVGDHLEIDKPTLALWSGGREVSDYARDKGHTPLEATRFGSVIDKLMLTPDWSLKTPLWNVLSKAFVDRARGLVHIFLRTYNPDSVLIAQEVPQLRVVMTLNSEVELVWHPVYAEADGTLMEIGERLELVSDASYGSRDRSVQVLYDYLRLVHDPANLQSERAFASMSTRLAAAADGGRPAAVDRQPVAPQAAVPPQVTDGAQSAPADGAVPEPADAGAAAVAADGARPVSGVRAPVVPTQSSTRTVTAGAGSGAGTDDEEEATPPDSRADKGKDKGKGRAVADDPAPTPALPEEDVLDREAEDMAEAMERSRVSQPEFADGRAGESSASARARATQGGAAGVGRAVGDGGELPFTAQELIEELVVLASRHSAVAGNDGMAATLGPDVFGDRVVPPPPDFLRGYDYEGLRSVSRAEFFRRLDLARTGPAPVAEDLSPTALGSDSRSVVGSAFPTVRRKSSVGLKPVRIPRLVHSIWLGGPLSAAPESLTAPFMTNVADSAAGPGRGFTHVIWTDVTRARIARAAEEEGEEGTDWAKVRDMVAWARARPGHNVVLVNVDEVFSSERPMRLEAAFRMEASRGVGAGYASASDILRLEILRRFGGIYTDGDNRLLGDLEREVERIVADKHFAIARAGVGGTGIANAVLIAPAGHRAVDEHLTVLERNYGRTSAENDTRGHFFQHRAGEEITPALRRMLDSVSGPPVWIQNHTTDAQKNAVLFLSGTGVNIWADLAHGLKLGGASSLPAVTAGVFDIGVGNTWVPPKRPVAVTVPTTEHGNQSTAAVPDREDVLLAARRLINTLTRELAYQEGKLALSEVAVRVAGNPLPELLWRTVIGFLARRRELREMVRWATVGKADEDPEKEAAPTSGENATESVGGSAALLRDATSTTDLVNLLEWSDGLLVPETGVVKGFRSGSSVRRVRLRAPEEVPRPPAAPTRSIPLLQNPATEHTVAQPQAVAAGPGQDPGGRQPVLHDGAVAENGVITDLRGEPGGRTVGERAPLVPTQGPTVTTTAEGGTDGEEAPHPATEGAQVGESSASAASRADGGNGSGIGDDRRAPYSAEELIDELVRRMTQVSAVAGNDEMEKALGPDVFGDRVVPPPPDFLRGYDYRALRSVSRVEFFRRLDLARRGPAPVAADLAPAALGSDSGSVLGSLFPTMSRKSSVGLKQVRIPRLVHSIWLGGPLSAAPGSLTAPFMTNVADSAGGPGQGFTHVVWTDVTRARIARAHEAEGTERDTPGLVTVRDMVAWAETRKVVLVNVDEVFSSERPMRLEAPFRMETSRGVGMGYASASDILRLEILLRFGGIYNDGDNPLVGGLEREVRNIAKSGQFAIAGAGMSDSTLSNAVLIAPAGHQAVESHLDVLRGNYLRTSSENQFRGVFFKVEIRNGLTVAHERVGAQVGEHIGRVRGHRTEGDRTSVLYLSGTGLNIWADLASALELKGLGDLPRVTPGVFGIGTGNTWLPSKSLAAPATDGQTSATADREDLLRAARHLINTLARELVYQNGKLALSEVADRVAANPWPELLWRTVIGFLARHERLRAMVLWGTIGNLDNADKEALYKYGREKERKKEEQETADEPGKGTEDSVAALAAVLRDFKLRRQLVDLLRWSDGLLYLDTGAVEGPEPPEGVVRVRLRAPGEVPRPRAAETVRETAAVGAAQPSSPQGGAAPAAPAGERPRRAPSAPTQSATAVQRPVTRQAAGPTAELRPGAGAAISPGLPADAGRGMPDTWSAADRRSLVAALPGDARQEPPGARSGPRWTEHDLAGIRVTVLQENGLVTDFFATPVPPRRGTGPAHPGTVTAAVLPGAGAPEGPSLGGLRFDGTRLTGRPPYGAPGVRADAPAEGQVPRIPWETVRELLNRAYRQERARLMPMLRELLDPARVAPDLLAGAEALSADLPEGEARTLLRAGYVLHNSPANPREDVTADTRAEAGLAAALLDLLGPLRTPGADAAAVGRSLDGLRDAVAGLPAPTPRTRAAVGGVLARIAQTRTRITAVTRPHEANSLLHDLVLLLTGQDVRLLLGVPTGTGEREILADRIFREAHVVSDGCFDMRAVDSTLRGL